MSPAQPATKSAMVLSGGGGYGAYEVGILRALCEGKSPATNFTPFHPDVVSGTSAGAFNAALFLSRSNPRDAMDLIESVWIDSIADSDVNCGAGVLRLRLNPRVLAPSCLAVDPFRPFVDLAKDTIFLTADILRRGVRFAQVQGGIDKRLAETLDISTIASTAPYVGLVQQAVDIGAVRANRTALRISATNWNTGSLEVFKNEDMTDETGHSIVLASGSIPGVFPPVKIGDQLYVDGGISSNTPLSPAVNAGADFVHIVYLDPKLSDLELPPIPNTLDTLYRMIAIALFAMTSRDLKVAEQTNRSIAEGKGRPGVRKLVVHKYFPRRALGGALRWFTFNMGQITRLIRLGYEDAVNHNCTEQGCII
jgi:NTE family protein